MSKFAPHRPSAANPRASQSTICQKCLGTGTLSSVFKTTATRSSRILSPRALHISMQEHSPICLSALANGTAREAPRAGEIEGRRQTFGRCARGIQVKVGDTLGCISFLSITNVLLVLCRKGTANKILEAKEKERAKEKEPERKRTRRCVAPFCMRVPTHKLFISCSSSSHSSSSSSDSDSESDSGSSDSGTDSDSTSSSRSSSRSRERDSKRRVPRRRSSSRDSGRGPGRSTSEEGEGGSSSRRR